MGKKDTIDTTLSRASAAAETLRRSHHEQEADAVATLVSLVSSTRGKYWTVGRAAEEIGMHRNTLRNWANTGRVRAFRRDGSDELLIPDSEVLRLKQLHSVFDELGGLTETEVERVIQEKHGRAVAR